MTTASKSVPKNAVKKEGTISAVIKDVPTDEEHKAKAKAVAEKKQVPKASDLISVQTVSGGQMYDPEANAWVEGKPTLAEKTSWLERQIKANKIKKVE